jgi:ribosomal protein S18 acetylase RimI-like enzyme
VHDADVPFTIERVTSDLVRPLRHEVLRSGRSFESTAFDGDDHPSAVHLAACLVTRDGVGDIVSVGTAYPDPPPWETVESEPWRIRGMATKDALRGRGIGANVLGSLVDHAREQGGDLIWCHARIGAVEFYRRAGFVVIGETFDDGVALHQSMWRTLEGPATSGAADR